MTSQQSYISLSQEHAQYLPEVEECFEGLGIETKADYYRKSEGDSVMQILISL